MRARTTAGLGFALTIAVCAIAAIPAGASTGAKAELKGTCSLTADEAESLGTSYVLPLKVKGTSCSKGEKVVKAFNQCRKDNGGADGRCKSKVLGFKCDEGKRESAPTQYNAAVSCKKGSKKVSFHYTQNT